MNKNLIISVVVVVLVLLGAYYYWSGQGAKTAEVAPGSAAVENAAVPEVDGGVDVPEVNGGAVKE